MTDQSLCLDYDLSRLFLPANAMQEKLIAIRQRALPPGDGQKPTIALKLKTWSPQRIQLE